MVTNQKINGFSLSDVTSTSYYSRDFVQVNVQKPPKLLGLFTNNINHFLKA